MSCRPKLVEAGHLQHDAQHVGNRNDGFDDRVDVVKEQSWNPHRVMLIRYVERLSRAKCIVNPLRPSLVEIQGDHSRS